MAFAAVVIVVVAGVRNGLRTLSSDTGFSLSLQSHTDATHTMLSRVQQLGEWEFLSIYDEVLIDTTRPHLLSQDDELARIYHGTLRLGIDLNECNRNWATIKGDTLRLNLPQHFIDEARTHSFYERGQWDGKAREDLYQRAHHAMVQRSLTPENLKKAEENAIQQIKALFRTLGYTKTEITITH